MNVTLKNLLKKCFSLTLLLLFIISPSLADDEKIQGRLTIANQEGLMEGDFVSAKLQIWPFPEADLVYFKEYEGKMLLNFFFVVKVLNASFSENNSQVAEVEMLLAIANKPSDQEFHILPHKGLNIPLEIRGPMISKFPQEPKAFLFDDQYVNKSNTIIYILVTIVSVIFLVLSGIGFFFYVRRRKRLEEEERCNRVRQKWIGLMNNSKSREELEYLFRKRNEWKNLVKDKKILNEVNQIIDIHQYKKELNDIAIQDIRDGLKKLSESI